MLATFYGEGFKLSYLIISQSGKKCAFANSVAQSQEKLNVRFEHINEAWSCLYASNIDNMPGDCEVKGCRIHYDHIYWNKISGYILGPKEISRFVYKIPDSKGQEMKLKLFCTQCSLGIYTFLGKQCSRFKEVLCIFPDLPNEFHLIRSLTLCRGCMCAQLVKTITPEAIPM